MEMQTEYSWQVQNLLEAPEDAALGGHYLSEVIRLSGAAASVEVRDAGTGRGKGIFAKRSFKRGDIIFQERPLVAIQSGSSSAEALVCSHCFCFIGSIEQQIARKLMNTLTRVETLSKKRGSQGGAAAGLEPGADRVAATEGDDEGEGHDGAAQVDLEEEEELLRKAEFLSAAKVDVQRLRYLAGGDERLPHTDRMPPLPQAISCRKGCGVQYCSQGCEAASWQLHHCLLCPRTAGGAGIPGTGNCLEVSSDGAEGGVQAGTEQSLQTRPGPESSLPSVPSSSGSSLSLDRIALEAFYSHARSSNEIFMLAAKVLAIVALRAEAGLRPGASKPGAAGPVGAVADGSCGGSAGREARSGSSKPNLDTGQKGGKAVWPTALIAADAAWQLHGDASDSSCAGPADSADVPAPSKGGSGLREADASSAALGVDPDGQLPPSSCPPAAWGALRAAWLPFAMGWKRVWWESVAVPEDVDDEAAFRQQLRDLAQSSLRLLVDALPGAAALLPPLFSLEVYGAVVGMFELNNLSLSVPSPVEDYFLLIDDLPEADKVAAQVVTQPLLDALDKSYDEACEGTGFYALQCCANHSCCPLGIAEGEASGIASILALGDISPGQEITISYIDECMSYKERQLALKDYGFKCSCEKCTQDRVERASRKPKAKRARI